MALFRSLKLLIKILCLACSNSLSMIELQTQPHETDVSDLNPPHHTHASRANHVLGDGSCPSSPSEQASLSLFLQAQLPLLSSFFFSPLFLLLDTYLLLHLYIAKHKNYFVPTSTKALSMPAQERIIKMI